jgi:hypothetical protein
MLRRSSRKTKAHATEDGAVHTKFSDSEALDEKTDYVKQPEKRRRAQKTTTQNAAQTEVVGKKTRGRRGSLKELVNMPLDVLFEVCTCEDYSWWTRLADSKYSRRSLGISIRQISYIWRGPQKSFVVY